MVYYVSLHEASGPVHEVYVTTKAGLQHKVHPLSLHARIPCLKASEGHLPYEQAIDVALRGVPVVHILKDCGIHRQVLYACPVKQKSTGMFMGVLIAVDLPPKGCCPDSLVAAAEGPSELERLVMEQLAAAGATRSVSTPQSSAKVTRARAPAHHPKPVAVHL
jgi:hypothetical protein